MTNHTSQIKPQSARAIKTAKACLDYDTLMHINLIVRDDEEREYLRLFATLSANEQRLFVLAERRALAALRMG